MTRLEAGYDADIVLFDPGRSVTLAAADLHSAIDHSIYVGELQVEPGHGRFVEREARR